MANPEICGGFESHRPRGLGTPHVILAAMALRAGVRVFVTYGVRLSKLPELQRYRPGPANDPHNRRRGQGDRRGLRTSPNLLFSCYSPESNHPIFNYTIPHAAGSGTLVNQGISLAASVRHRRDICFPSRGSRVRVPFPAPDQANQGSQHRPEAPIHLDKADAHSGSARSLADLTEAFLVGKAVAGCSERTIGFIGGGRTGSAPTWATTSLRWTPQPSPGSSPVYERPTSGRLGVLSANGRGCSESSPHLRHGRRGITCRRGDPASDRGLEPAGAQPLRPCDPT
jgi:hypothetical protein